jgi:ABC-2 type transport system ATP-binding protein
MERFLLEARGLRKVYKRAKAQPLIAVDHIDLQVRSGEIFSLLGPNGAGKTTTISMLCGLLKPSEGDAIIDGHSITHQPIAAKQRLGIVPQEIALYDRFSPLRNLRFFGQLYGLRGADLDKRIDEILELVDLSDRRNDPVASFSGGMKRRINIAAGLLHRPALLFMDEPTVGIDPQNRRRVLDLIKHLRDQYGITVFYTSHLMEEVQELSDRIAIVDHGRLIALGTLAELVQQIGEEDRITLQLAQAELSPQLRSQLAARFASPIRLDIQADSEHQHTIIQLFAKQGRKLLPQLLQLLNDADQEVQSIDLREPDLEAVFLSLTGRQLRD